MFVAYRVDQCELMREHMLIAYSVLFRGQGGMPPLEIVVLKFGKCLTQSMSSECMHI